MECKFCKNMFSSKANLNSHQKNAKYCLKLRDMEIDTKYKCDGCRKMFSNNYHLTRHVKTCTSNDKLHKLETTITQLEKELDIYKFKLEEKNIHLEKQQKMYENHIRELEGKIENIAIHAVSRPTTSNKTQINNYIQNMKPITDDNFVNNVQHLTIDHILKGPEGYAEYALEYPLKDKLLCVDYARRKVKFKDKDGNIITDPEMTNLATKFFNSIKDKNKELIVECSAKLKENFGDEVDTIVKIFDYKSGVERSSDGEKSDFHHDFVKQVCSKTIRE